jgi:hypothetical protein
MISEEHVTRSLLTHLKSNGWNIICFDYPQSGTGRVLHPNKSSSKNLDSIIPDIVAVKDRICLVFENKNRFYLPDFQKLHSLITENQYSDDFDVLLANNSVNKMYFGIGIPLSGYTTKCKKNQDLVDFIIGVEEGDCEVLYAFSEDLAILLSQL